MLGVEYWSLWGTGRGSMHNPLTHAPVPPHGQVGPTATTRQLAGGVAGLPGDQVDRKASREYSDVIEVPQSHIELVRKPEIAELIPDGDLVWRGRATDNTSHIARIEYNLDGEKWEILQAKDGIFDNREEEFRVELKNVTPGEHVLTVRAFDEGGNIGLRQVGFTQP